MRFKDWLEVSGVATSLLHGGIQDLPGERLNTNFPVRSKISTKDGSDQTAADDLSPSPERVFGINKPKDHNARSERGAQYIDKNKRKAPMEIVPPDIIY